MVVDAQRAHQIEAAPDVFVQSTEPDEMDLHRIAHELNALPLLLDMGGCLAIRPNGEIISFAWDEGNSAAR